MKYKVILADTTLYHVHIEATSEDEARALVRKYGWNKDEEVVPRQTERFVFSCNIVEDHDGE